MLSHNVRRAQWACQNPRKAIDRIIQRYCDKAPDAKKVESLIQNFTRRDDIAYLLRKNGIGIELGVAAGGFSEKILQKSALRRLYGVDMWSDGGHVQEYKIALQRLMPHQARSSLLKMRFEEALELFPQSYFDFIYADGYAHTGEEGGKTFDDWWPKLKSGGIFAGDDYSEEWPLVIKAVNKFIEKHHLRMFIIEQKEATSDGYARQPTWFVIKP